MKARKPKRLDPYAPFGAGIRTLLALRLDELYSFAGDARDPAQVQALHDMRIAAKRVRYLLEVAEPALGQPARAGIKTTKRLQELLGEIHDCDELLPLIERHVEKLRAEDVAAVGRQIGDLGPQAVREAPNRTRYRGLASLTTYVRARREALFGEFQRFWPQVEALRKQLEREAAAV